MIKRNNSSHKQYINKIEQEILFSLINQFDMQILALGNRTLYEMTLYIKRPIGFYSLANVRTQFILYCEENGWLVHKADIIEDCLLQLCVSEKPKRFEW